MPYLLPHFCLSVCHKLQAADMDFGLWLKHALVKLTESFDQWQIFLQ